MRCRDKGIHTLMLGTCIIATTMEKQTDQLYDPTKPSHYWVYTPHLTNTRWAGGREDSEQRQYMEDPSVLGHLLQSLKWSRHRISEIMDKENIYLKQWNITQAQRSIKLWYLKPK